MNSVSMESAIEIIKSDSDNLIKVMEYYGVTLKNNQALCQFHSDKNPSMGTKGGRYKCFTCGASGDLLDFIRFKDNLNLIEAIKKAIDILCLSITVKKTKLDSLREYIQDKMGLHYQDSSFKLDAVHFYHNSEGEPKLVRIKYKNKETSKKKYSQANIVTDQSDYYKLDFKSKKINLIYNMPRVVKNIQENKNIFLVEGEKDADSLIRLGLAATTCREINSVDDEILKPLHGAKLIVIADNDLEGEKHIQNIRKKLLNKVVSFKNLKLKGIYDLGEKADISDFIEYQFEKGLSTKDIRTIILNQVNRSLDEKNINELQQDNIGIYYKTEKFDKEGELIDIVRSTITNFNVLSLTRIENIDTDEEVIELALQSSLGEKKTIVGRSNKIFLDIKAFNSFMNMAFVFDGKPKDFNKFKIWVNQYFLLEKRNEYLVTGIRDIDNKKMLITNTGALLTDGTIDSNYKANNNITKIDFTSKSRLSKDEAIELSKNLFSFNSKKNCINIVGSLVSNMFNSIYRESQGINVHVTSYVGESGSGKSFTIDSITRPLLNLDNDTMVFSAIMPHGLLKSLNDTYLTTIIDEVKPSQAGEFKRQLLSNTIRSITGDTTVIKGTQTQDVKTYKYNSSLIIAGEEALDETALKNRCNIIWFSCNDMSNDTLAAGNYFLTKEGKKALESLGMEIYLYIMNTFNSDKLVSTLDKIEKAFEHDTRLHPRIQSTFNNTMLGYITAKHLLKDIGGYEVDLEEDNKASGLIYQNLKENVLDGEFATKQIYDEILEAIDTLASGTNQFAISEDLHYKQDITYLKFDFKSIYPVLEGYYRSRGKSIPIDCKTFIKMITKSKYVEGTSREYNKAVNLDGKTKRCYFIKKDALSNLDMDNLIPKAEWEEI